MEERHAEDTITYNSEVEEKLSYPPYKLEIQSQITAVSTKTINSWEISQLFRYSIRTIKETFQ